MHSLTKNLPKLRLKNVPYSEYTILSIKNGKYYNGKSSALSSLFEEKE